MIYTYAAMLGLLLICEIGAGIAAFVLKGELKDVVEEKMVQGMKNYSKYINQYSQLVTKEFRTICDSFLVCFICNK